jgi:glucose/arabinose dehydrogenase
MVRTRSAFAALALMLLVASTGLAQSAFHYAAGHNFRVVTVAEGFEKPWSMAWLPNGDMLVTERPGRLRIIRDGELLTEPVSGVPEVHARGQGGMLDVVVHPDFENNELIYLSYSKPVDDNSTTVVSRARLIDDALVDFEEIFVADTNGRSHYGSRIAFDADGYMFVSVGERQAPSTGDLEAHPAQDLSNHHGVIVRLHDDGSVPEDNPFVGQEGARPEIWSYGHRNPQGLTIHPETGTVFATEHGPQGGDEVNVILPGNNYGWPVIGYGVNYGSGSAIHEGTTREGMEQPTWIWVPSIAASGLDIYDGDKFPRWRGSMFAGGLAGEVLVRLTLDGDDVVEQATLLRDIGRVRDVRQGPDGYIYLAIEGGARGTTPIVRLEPVEGR